MLSIISAESLIFYCTVSYCYAECHVFIVMVNAILLSVFLLSKDILGLAFFTVMLRHLPAKYRVLSVVLLSVMESFVEFFWFKRVLDRGPEQRESKMTVL